MAVILAWLSSPPDHAFRKELLVSQSTDTANSPNGRFDKMPPAYPLPRPTAGTDQRFTMGLLADVAAVIARHGYPPVAEGADLVELHKALYRFIYGQRGHRA